MLTHGDGKRSSPYSPLATINDREVGEREAVVLALNDSKEEGLDIVVKTLGIPEAHGDKVVVDEESIQTDAVEPVRVSIPSFDNCYDLYTFKFILVFHSHLVEVLISHLLLSVTI